VLVVSANSIGETAIRQNRAAIDAAKAAGAGRIVYTSHMGVDPASPFPPMAVHAATEAALRDSGVAYTALRNGFYAASARFFLGDALTTGESVAPEDGPIAYTSHPDLAKAAAIALTGEDLDGATPNLTAAEAVDLAGVAALASERSGRPIRRVVVPDAAYLAGLVAKGIPKERADMLVGLFAASRQGPFARVDPTLAHLLGRPATPLRDVLKAAIPPTG